MTFVNQDCAPHAIVASGVELTTPALTTGQSFPYVLTKSGKLNYRQTGDKNFPGEIEVQRTGSVTLALAVQQTVVPFGSSVTLTGTTSLAAFPVVVQKKLNGETSWSNLATLTPAADGSFSTVLQPPRIRPSTGRTCWGEHVEVRAAGRPGRGDAQGVEDVAQTGKHVGFTAQVTPGPVTSVTLMQYNARRTRWQKVKTQSTVGGRTDLPLAGRAREDTTARLPEQGQPRSPGSRRRSAAKS